MEAILVHTFAAARGPGLKEVAFERLLKEYLVRNRGPGYSVRISSLADDMSWTEAQVRFENSNTYCCPEPLCHFPQDLTRCFGFAASMDFLLPKQFKPHWRIVTEAGAMFTVNASFGLPLASDYSESKAVSHVAFAE